MKFSLHNVVFNIFHANHVGYSTNRAFGLPFQAVVLYICADIIASTLVCICRPLPTRRSYRSSPAEVAIVDIFHFYFGHVESIR